MKKKWKLKKRTDKAIKEEVKEVTGEDVRPFKDTKERIESAIIFRNYERDIKS